jgi:hypothetical protein
MSYLKHSWIIALVTSALTAAEPPPAADKPTSSVDFDRDIRPILAQRCYECHGPQKQKGGLRFDRKSVVFKPSDSGKPAIVAGNTNNSPLLQKVSSMDPDEVMPPKGAKLTAPQIALLRGWIAQGAPWPDDVEKKHWAYEQPARSPLPKVNDSHWPRNPIDFFVLKRLEQEKLAPSVEADRPTLIRRVSLDLIGLPPTLREVDDFVTDNRPNAYEKLVDRLLASPRYGERWARSWLDLARYADTQGYEKDSRRTVWPYRDWVISALNRNLSFDQFTIEQIAGDLLPDATQDQKVATGFHRNTMTNTEGGTDNEEFRYEAVVDRINTTFAVWMGTTLACAQCHNHKYDPFTTVEYYRIMAFLNNTEDADYDDEKPTLKVFQSAQQKERLRQLRDLEKAAEKTLNDAVTQPEFARALSEWEKKVKVEQTAWETLDPTDFTSAGGANLSKTPSKSILAEGKNPSNDTYTVTAPIAAGRFTGIRLDALETGPDKAVGRHANGAFVLRAFDLAVPSAKAESGSAVTWKSVSADFSEKDFDVTQLLTGKGDGWAIGASDPKNRVRRSAYFTLAEPLDLPEGGTLTFTLRHSDKHPGANLRRFRLYATRHEQVGPSTPLNDEVRAILAVTPDKREQKQRDKLTEFYRAIDSTTKPLHDAYIAARKTAEDFDKTIPISSVMVELNQPRETRRHVRGAYLSTAEVVTPGTPESLHPFPTKQPLNRLGLARWLVATNNPLTARVMLNRFWEQYFGKGFVETLEEYGKQGEPPSHPELLDWLACEFMSPAETEATFPHPQSLAWDMKHMHRLIVTSATYRQSSKVAPDLIQRDPFNRLLARGPRVRLEAEMVRDQALAVSGLLSPKIGGPSVMPPQPEGLWQVVYSGDKWDTSKGDDKYRRGLYTFWRRSMPHPAMVTFDAPSREYCVLRRTRSNTPLQALNLLNDPAYIEAAQALARRMMTETGPTLADRVTYGFRLCLARPPKAAEVQRLITLYEQELVQFQQDAKAAEKMATSELGQPSRAMDLKELAAWTVVANVLLNLDEMISKG